MSCPPFVMQHDHSSDDRNGTVTSDRTVRRRLSAVTRRRSAGLYRHSTAGRPRQPIATRSRRPSHSSSVATEPVIADPSVVQQLAEAAVVSATQHISSQFLSIFDTPQQYRKVGSLQRPLVGQTTFDRLRPNSCRVIRQKYGWKRWTFVS